jgi:exodeoxyribonuclease VII large subunit
VAQIPLFQPAPLTISQINRYVQELLAADDLLRDVWVQGEISNFTRAASGHIYLTLKDGLSTLKSVIWKTSAAKIRFPLANGLAVEAHGTVGVYERDGIYQLYIDTIRPAGEGRLYQEFLRLKARLEALGLFDESRKRNLPAFPQRIGLVTSPTGAALQDMLNTFARRYPLAEVILSPSAVQGETAPAEIIRALRKLWQLDPPPDVLIVARGGGSLEDLWAFNNELVVQAIADSPIPVVTGIGHETDFTLSDFAADRRAPTPTGAAEIAVPDRSDLAAGLGLLKRRLNLLIRQQLTLQRAETSTALSRLERASPRRRLDSERQRLDAAVERLGRARDHNMILRQAALDGLRSHLDALNPLAVLRRGYAAVFRLDGLPLTSTAQIETGQTVRVRLIDGRFDAQVTDVAPTGE